MAGLPAVCDNGHRYEDHSVFLGEGVSGATFIGNRVSPCPVCGAWASIVDGTYDVRGGVSIRRAVTDAVRDVRRQGFSSSELEEIRDLLRAIKTDGRSQQGLAAEIETGLTGHGEGAWWSSPQGMAAATWLQVLIAVVGLVLMLKSGNSHSDDAPDPTPSPTQINQIIEQLQVVFDTPHAAPSAARPPAQPRRQKGSDRCRCGSGKLVKNCHRY